MSHRYHEGNRELQDRFDTRRLADHGAETWVHGALTESDRAFIERADMFFLATCDEQGQPNCSYKGGEPGFVRVVDEHTVAFPNYDGNGMYLSTGNVLVHPRVGMLFIDFERGHRMRLNGVATIDETDPLLEQCPEAQFIVRVVADEVFPNCPRYIHKYQLVERSQFVPRRGRRTPTPDWKQDAEIVKVLPARDRIRHE